MSDSKNSGGAPTASPAAPHASDSKHKNGSSHGVSAHGDLHEVLHHLAHYLPSQAPLKDFIHHNTLHAFQTERFHPALAHARASLGFRTYLSLDEFRGLHRSGAIRPDVLERVLAWHLPAVEVGAWRTRLLDGEFDAPRAPRIGTLRAHWKRDYKIDLDSQVHPLLFKLANSFLDQGVAIWHFPIWDRGLLDSLREVESKALISLFNRPRARRLLLDPATTLPHLLSLVVGDERYWEQYLYDQQFAHPGWSGMVAVLETQPAGLLDRRKVSLQEFIMLELLLELDALDRQFGENWLPLAQRAEVPPLDVMANVSPDELDRALMIWQDAFEWSYYDDVLAGLSSASPHDAPAGAAPFQLVMCIDDRSCSVRRYVEAQVPGAATFGTPGFFGIDTYYQPAEGKHPTKVCPAPVTPRHLIKEVEAGGRHRKDLHFAKQTHGVFSGWFIAQTVGFWAALRLILNIFRPTATSGTALAANHIATESALTVEHKGATEGGLQVGYTVPEMAQRVQAMLTSIGLVRDFAPLVYVVGHGSSSINNPHYSAYDCGACSGRPGSLNSRAFCEMANHPAVRALLAERGFTIPASTVFLAGLHDTSRDEFIYYGATQLPADLRAAHDSHARAIELALDRNSKERSRRFESIDSRSSPAEIHELVRLRTVSLFEPRPELNHATNALCIVGRRVLTDHLFLDRRAFLNSYDWRIDPEGKYLLGILNAAAPVCGGINLEYYFSRVDNQVLGAGTKLPHNVMGLIGVANGMEGDLRPGLPVQMIEVHDPVRLMIVVEHLPAVVLQTIKTNPATYEWFANEWVHLVVVDPLTRALHRFRDGAFEPFTPLRKEIPVAHDLERRLETTVENMPVLQLDLGSQSGGAR